MEETVKFSTVIIGEDLIDISLFGKLLSHRDFSSKTFTYSNYRSQSFAGVSVIFLFFSKDTWLVEDALSFFSGKAGAGKLMVLVSSSSEARLLSANARELISDHLLFPADNLLVEKRLEIYKKLLSNNNHAANDFRRDSENDLERSILELEEQNVAKDKFFALIAHDLKNPFTGFLGFSEYIAKYYEEISKEDLGDFSVRMYESAQLVYNLIENLLAWSRLRTGNMDFEPIPFDLKETVERILKLCESQIVSKEINLINSFNERLSVFADANMVDTVIRNVVTNAIKFTPKGGVMHIGFSTDKEFVTLFIADSGIGISEEAQKKMFKLGYRVSRDGTEGETGTGLGLILSKEFMLKNGGDLYFESNEGNGSKFFIKIPATP
ncbi:hypothetical protein MASR1M107_20390 [Ignavibacteriales bacterium]